MPYIWLAVHDATAISAGAYLVVKGFPWWGAVCFAMAIFSTIKTNSK